MGTSLTGLTPATTYDALIKVGDNGPLSATAKVLSDGLGNDSVLALSTSNVGIGTTNANRLLVVQQNSTNTYNAADPTTFNQIQAVRNTTSGTGYNSFLAFASEPNGEWYLGSINKSNFSDFVIVGRDATYGERMRITSDGNVGIGTSAPQSRLETFGASPIVTITDSNTFSSGVARTGGIEFKAFNPSANNTTQSASIYGVINPETGYTQNEGYLTFYTRAKGGSYSEKMRIQAGGGISFNGDTAAANALDDYEEGTWTIGVSFGGGTTGQTNDSNTGTYTKIGRQVTVNGFFRFTNKGSSTGAARITGLPFIIGASNLHYSTAALSLFNITFANQYYGYGQVFSNEIFLEEVTEAGVFSNLTDADFANNSAIMLSMTYFV